MKNADSKSPHQKLCNSPQIQMVFLGSLLKKGCFVLFFKSEQKSLVTKKLKLPSKSLDNFAACLAAVFKLRKVSLFFY